MSFFDLVGWAGRIVWHGRLGMVDCWDVLQLLCTGAIAGLWGGWLFGRKR